MGLKDIKHPQTETVETANSGPPAARALARSRAREKDCSKPSEKPVPPGITTTLAQLLNDGDLELVVKVYREGLQATQRIWVESSDVNERGRRRGEWKFVPDWRTRKACADMIAAYKEGLPVQRQIVLTQKFQGASEKLEKLRASPTAMKALTNLRAAGVEVKVDGEALDGNFEIVQKSGSEYDDVPLRETPKE